MARARGRSQSNKLAVFAIAGSVSLHGAFALAMLLRPEPPPRLQVGVTGPGEGVVRAAAGALDCGEQCTGRYPKGTVVELRAAAGEGSTFEGWPEPCEVADSPLSCRLVMREDTRLEVVFGVPPEEVEVAWLADGALPDRKRPPIEMVLPDIHSEPPLPAVPPDEEVEAPADEEPADTPPPREQPELAKMKSVEVPDENEVEEAPDDAQFLSDKHRDVEEETHATETNLERPADGEAPASEESELDLDDIGGKEDVIAGLERPDPSEPEAVPEPAPSEPAPPEAGEEGEGGQAEPDREPGMLSMRELRGEMPGGPLAEPAEPDRAEAPDRPGKPGPQRLETQLSFDDYARIVGEERLREEQESGRRRLSQREGRWERRQAALRASLENFTPEVRPGNQTALKTRAAPFAVYIARMHRQIHELWGHGFLEELSRKSPGHELNQWALHTVLEIVIGPAGDVDRTTIVQPSGVLAFDVAAIDAVQTAAPYEAPPSAIRSANDKTYVHWTFHRDWRQCGTFGAHPYILDNPPDESRRLDDSDLAGR